MVAHGIKEREHSAAQRRAHIVNTARENLERSEHPKQS
jgi:hypothetical protein